MGSGKDGTAAAPFQPKSTANQVEGAGSVRFGATASARECAETSDFLISPENEMALFDRSDR
jgi:hypothetical protein